MFKWIKAWFERRRQFRAQADFMRGRRWALDELTSGRMTPEQISDRIYDPIDPCNAFDRGAMKELYDWELSFVDPEALKEKI